MKTDVSGTEAFFKSIVAGDPISGCYKGQDFVDFRPRCKMVFSANRMLTAREVDFGFLRRFCFIEFPVTFVDEETNRPLEKKKDPGIEKVLLGELSGIFNWAYAGLKALRDNGHFTGTSDQTEMEKELLSQSNPVTTFVEDILGNGGPKWKGRLTRSNVYQEYCQWCHETNTMTMSTRSFWPRLRQILPYKESRTGDGRFVEFDFEGNRCGENCGNVGKKQG